MKHLLSFTYEKIPGYMLYSVFCLVATVTRWKVLFIYDSVQSVRTQTHPEVHVFQGSKEDCLTSLSLMPQRGYGFLLSKQNTRC